MSTALETKSDALSQRVSLGACPVCRYHGSKPWKILKGWSLRKCSACSMIYADPCPTEEALQVAYGLPEQEYDEFFQSGYIDSRKILGGQGKWQRHKAQEHLEAIERRTHRKGRILELGCGPGVFLDVARSRGWQTAGIDPGDWREGYDKDDELNIRRCSLFEAGFEENSFDVIYMGSVLEHLLYPRRYLERLLSLLKPGGLMYVAALPNIGSWTIQLGIDRWIGNHPPLHLLFFSRRTGRRIFENVGFEVTAIHCYGMSETILEAIFNGGGKTYSGEYVGQFVEPSLRGRLLRWIRICLNRVFDLTGTGSVLEVFAAKPSIEPLSRRSR